MDQLFRMQVISQSRFLGNLTKDFHGGSVVKNLSASSGDVGSIPDPGRYHKRATKAEHHNAAAIPEAQAP